MAKLSDIHDLYKSIMVHGKYLQLIVYQFVLIKTVEK